MSMIPRTTLLLVAIATALAAPLAFAQSTPANATTQDSSLPNNAQAATPATPATPATSATSETAAMPATPATPVTPATHSSTSGKVTWSDLDGDKDGKLTKTEAAALDSLTQVFDKADADKDGALTPDEYKAYLAVNGKAGGHGG
jgi:hypothetical protein